ncbi:hypothetical protein T07_12930, partial [Trichinella nelsoni]
MKFSLFLLKRTNKNSCTEEICYTLKPTNRNDKCWICASGMRGCPGKLCTNLDATQVIRTGEHADGCPVDAHAFYHQQQLNELNKLAAGNPRPVLEIYHGLASNASTSIETAAHFPTWEQARNTMYYSRSKRYPRLPARRQDLRLTAVQTTTKSGAQFLMYHSPTSDTLIFANEAGVRLLAQSNCWCSDILSTDNTVLFCKACGKTINHEKRYFVYQYMQ